MNIYYVPATMLSIADKATNTTDQNSALVVPLLNGVRKTMSKIYTYVRSGVAI